MNKISKAFRAYLNAVTAQRPRTVIQHLLKHGHITSQELQDLYGYNHPPRAIRDVRELGIPIITYRIEGKHGRHIAAYKFGDLTSSPPQSTAKHAGRTALTKALKEALIERYGAKCAIYLEEMDAATLQVDHRIPYEVGGEVKAGDVEQFMLLSPSANRAKSWACEHCENWTRKEVSFCLRCFWAHPEQYTHIAGRAERALQVLFTGNEVADYEALVRLSGATSAQATLKRILHNYLDRKDSQS